VIFLRIVVHYIKVETVYCVLRFIAVFIVKINKAVALQNFKIEPYITGTEILNCSKNIEVSTLIIVMSRYIVSISSKKYRLF